MDNLDVLNDMIILLFVISVDRNDKHQNANLSFNSVYQTIPEQKVSVPIFKALALYCIYVTFSFVVWFSSCLIDLHFH